MSSNPECRKNCEVVKAWEELEADNVWLILDKDELQSTLDEKEKELAKYKKWYDDFFEFLQSIYEIESKGEFEELAKGWDGNNALMVAAHHTWKRNPRVEGLVKELAEARDALFKISKNIN